jgi:hypothetical protein
MFFAVPNATGCSVKNAGPETGFWDIVARIVPINWWGIRLKTLRKGFINQGERGAMTELLNTLFFFGLISFFLLLIAALVIACFAAGLTSRHQRLQEEPVRVNPYR